MRTRGVVQSGAKGVIQTLGRLGLGHGGEPSVGRGQMKAFTARRILAEAGYLAYDQGYIRRKLTYDDEFAVFMAALHLKIDLNKGMSEKQAYLSHSLDPQTAPQLLNPASSMVRNSSDLSARSARYDADMAALDVMRAESRWGYIPDVIPKHGAPGGLCPVGGICHYTGHHSPLYPTVPSAVAV